MYGPPRRPPEALPGDGAQRRTPCPPGSVRSGSWHTTARRVRDSCKDGSRARTRPRYTLHLETMGTLADRLAALIAEMEESDRRLAALVADTRELIARTEAELAEERPE